MVPERVMLNKELVLVPDEPLKWYALRVRSNHERLTSAHLRARGVEEFSPTFTTERQWSDRKKKVEQFLFSSYVFCRLDPDRRVPIASVPGAVGLVSFGSGPAEIPALEIEAVRRMTDSGLVVAPWPFLQVGQPVVIERGPLAGVEGILQEIRKTFRLVISIGLLQRSVSAEVDRSWIRPVRRGVRQPIPAASGVLPLCQAPVRQAI
jgi:transcription antitermination factor NusG